MFRKIFIILFLLLFCFNFGFAKKKQTFDELTVEILETLQSFYPVHSTGMGIHAYDNRFADYSSKPVKAMLKSLNNYEKKLYKYKAASLSEYDRVNYKLIKSEVDIAILNLKRIRWHKKSPQLYVDEAVNGLYYLVLSNHAPLSEKIVPIIHRMKAVPALFTSAKKNIKNPPKIYIETASESLEAAIKFYKEVAAELMNQFPERADEILKISSLAREAMNDFLIYLSEITPGQNTAFAIGKDNFDYMLSHKYFLEYDSDSLLKIGQALFEKIDASYKKYQDYVDSKHQNGSDSVFIPAVFTKDDILNYYNWETDQVKIFLENKNLITIPGDIADVNVIETPRILQTMVGGIAYQPAGPFNLNQTAFFYVRPIPNNLDRRQLESRYRYVNRRGFKGSVVHEAYPGHHLQMQITGRIDDPLRKWVQNSMFIEGWALYSEEMMYKAGLYGKENPSQWLQVLGSIRFRAARIIADVKLHTGLFTFDECLNWMAQALDMTNGSSKGYLKTEVSRYTYTPTYQMSYLMGKQEIVKLRDAYMKKTGSSYSMREFHDQLLSDGSIPPALIWDIMGLQK